MLNFFHSPGSCSDGVLFLLNEVGAEFEVHVVNVRAGEQHVESYQRLNPKGKVPALLCDDGELLTEFQAIAYWLAKRYPEAGLWPRGAMAQARVLEALDYLVGTVHMRGFTFVIAPQKFIAGLEEQAALREHGRAEVENALRNLSRMMGNYDYLLGEFSLADAALFYVLGWARLERFDLPDNLSSCLKRLSERRIAAPSA